MKNQIQKKQLRQHYMQLRNEMPLSEREEKTRNIHAALFSSDAYKTAQTVFCFISMQNEIDTLKIIEHCWQNKKTVAIPAVISKAEGMIFRKITNLNHLTKSKFGVLEPTEGDILVPDESTIMIVPGIVFSKNFYRIGYGGGFYDKYLSNDTAAKTVGIAFDFQIIDYFQPEIFDIPVQMIVTETDTMRM